MAKIVAFGGISNSGKSTLIQKLIIHLKEKYSVLAIKHDSKNKAQFDREGKDSFCFFQAGADVVLSSEEKSAIFLHHRQNLQKICLDFDWKDFILIEGYKDFEIPRICIAREKIVQEELQKSQALALEDKRLCENLDFNGAILDLNNIYEIFSWIQKNAKEVGEIQWIQ